MSDKTILETMTTTQPCCVKDIEDFVKGWKTITLENEYHNNYFTNGSNGKLCTLLANMWIRDFTMERLNAEFGFRLDCCFMNGYADKRDALGWLDRINRV